LSESVRRRKRRAKAPPEESRTHVIAIANTKGGVGKSTLAVNLAVEATTAGHRTLLIDADPQGSAAQFVAVRDEDRPQFEAVQLTKPTLHRRMKWLSAFFDYVLIDVGGRDAPVLRSAIAAARTVIVPLVPSAFDAWASEDVFDIIDEIQAAHPGLAAYVVPNLVHTTTIAREAMLALEELLAEYDGIRFIDVPIQARTAWPEAVGEGVSVVEFQPRSKAAQDLRQLSRVLGIRP
jgi:chromosome partitioning protein